jgi:hypothetical protein
MNFFQLIPRFTMAPVRGGIKHVSHHVTEVKRVYRGHTGNYGHLNLIPNQGSTLFNMENLKHQLRKPIV